MAQFIVTGRAMCGSRGAVPITGEPPPSAGDWVSRLMMPSRATKKRRTADMPAMWPLLRHRGRKKAAENAGPYKQLIRRSPAIDGPARPEDWRAKVIRNAWKQRDWWTLKAMGEIDEVPEP